MSSEKRAFIPVDELMPMVAVEQAATFYGKELPQLDRVGSEIRSRCFLACGKSADTGDRVLAIQADHPAKQWKCHQKGCGKAGNLVSMCDLLKPGESAGGKPRGDRFKKIAADLAAMVAGVIRGNDLATAASAVPAAPPKPVVNMPLSQSENERARALIDLDAKFVRDVGAMPPKVSAYLRRRHYLTPEACQAWRMGYLPRDAGEDKSGGTMRGKIVYPYVSIDGELLTWFGRDVEFGEKHQEWEKSDKSEKKPEEFRFVKGFHWGLELFGQERLRSPAAIDQLRGIGVVIVADPHDVIRLAEFGLPAVATCTQGITREQSAKAAALAREVGGGVVTILFECTAAGEVAMRQALGYLAQLVPLRLAWNTKMHAGKFQGRRPEDLAKPELESLMGFLKFDSKP